MSEPSRLDVGEVGAFTEQARWLLDFHNKRSDSVAQKAIALLGFIGVILALVPAGLTLGKGFRATPAIKTELCVCVVFLLVAGFSCLRVLSLRKVSAPTVDELGVQWLNYARGGGRGLVHAQIAHTYLGGDQTKGPLRTAHDEADRRACWFKWGLRALLVALTALAALTMQVFIQY